MTEQETYDIAFEHIIKMEGGYVNDPDDPGGATKFGISDLADGIRDDRYKGQVIKEITLADAKKIYKAAYWDKAKCWAAADPALAICLFDCAVNMGVVGAVRLLQAAMRMVLVDGVFGPKTLQAAKEHALILPHQILLERVMFYSSLKTYKKFGRGWIARAINTYRLSIKVRTGQTI